MHKTFLSDLVSQETIEKMVNYVDTIDGLVLCDGIVGALPFSFCSRDKYCKIFNVIFFAPIELLRLLEKKEENQ